MDSPLSIIGSVASLASAVWAFVEARKASSSATRAELVRNELLDRRSLVEISALQSRTESALRAVSKIGPSSDIRRFKGIEPSAIAKEVEDFASELSANAHLLVNSDIVEMAKTLAKDLAPDIRELSDASDKEKIKDIGSRMYRKIDDFKPSIKQSTTFNQYRTSTSVKG